MAPRNEDYSFVDQVYFQEETPAGERYFLGWRIEGRVAWLQSFVPGRQCYELSAKQISEQEAKALPPADAVWLSLGHDGKPFMWLPAGHPGLAITDPARVRVRLTNGDVLESSSSGGSNWLRKWYAEPDGLAVVWPLANNLP